MAGRGRQDPEECKMFVGGLTRDTTADMLKGYFSYYGRIVHAVVMTNPETQKSRGFGFVAFDRPEVVDRVIMSGPHFLDGKQIDPKPSVPKDLRPKPPQVEQPKKAFLGGLPLEMNEADMRDFFSRYGVVTECYIMFDEKRMKSRGFGFVSFEDESIVDDLVSQHYIEVRNKRVEVKLARPRENPLAPLNSEGRVLSADAEQQRVVVAAAASTYSHPPQASYYDHYSSYPAPHPPPRRRPADLYYDGPPFDDGPAGPPAPKRPRARTPPEYSGFSAGPSYSGGPISEYRPDYNYSHGGYDDRSAPYGGDVSPPGARPSSFSSSSRNAVATKPLPALSTAASYPSSSTQSSSFPLDSASMTPESMTTLMQQAMQSVGSGMGMNMMMMPMLMTQMFMGQAQTMFQSMMQQRKTVKTETSTTPGTSKSDGQGTAPPGDMMDVMKNVLQTLMTTVQQQQEQSTSKSDTKREVA